MLVTDSFVFLHIPKTAGTFVTRALEDVYAKTGRNLTNLDDGSHRSKHGFLRDIPAEHRHKPVIACLRNPFDHYVSHYEFRWWHTAPNSLFDDIEMKHHFPDYPNLSFAEFLTSVMDWYRSPKPERAELAKSRIGFLTRQYLYYLCDEPEAVISALAAGQLEAFAIARNPRVRLLHTETINTELADFLESTGFTAEETAELRAAAPALPHKPQASGAHRANQNWQSYYTPELVDLVRRHDRLLFEAFPEYRASTPDIQPNREALHA